MYKIISKILANRLVVVLGGLVNEIQSAFVADKQILDGPFILNELVQWCKKKKKQSLVFKVDLKSLHISFQRVVDVGLFKGIELAHSLNLSCMFYADDAIFMGQLSESNIDTIVKVSDCFNHASGLRINMTKRSKVGRCMSRIQSWNETIETMACRLSKWKLKSLSIGGRLTLFKYVVWHFITEGSSLWARVIKALHGYDGKIGQKVKSCYPSLWLDIIHEVEMFKSRGIDLVSLIHSNLGNGANTSFWEVAWRGGSPFKSIFPRGVVEIQQFEHMKEKYSGLVNEIQSAFVADKQILDGSFILNELVQWCKKKKKQSLVFKVDFKKTYDSVRWDHLDDIMRKFGFGEKWCLYKGIELALSLNLSHMFYVDDAIFMGQWSESNIDTIMKVLDCFNHASGLRINMTKSKLLGISVEDDKVKQ
nr:RNA-directed DNA polymerase, eukaryota [Tanacetum cinerariifolium]